MNVLIGVCGLGNGHTYRQIVLVDYLISTGYRVILLVNGQSEEVFKLRSDVVCINVDIPFIVCKKNGMEFGETLQYLLNKNFLYEYFETFKRIDDIIGNDKIQLVITDYEPISAQYSYIKNIKLITLEQQSKYLGYKTSNLGMFGPEEEASRLRYFFPKAELRLSASFFPLSNDIKSNYDVRLVGPIINHDVLKIKPSESNEALIYLSPFSKNNDATLAWLKKVIIINSKINFNVFTSIDHQRYFSDVKASIYKFDRENFIDKLSKCSFVISNAGHQLISEAIFLEKPVFVVSFNTYEQIYNAHMLENYGLGRRVDFSDFQFDCNEINLFREGIIKYKKTVDYNNRINDFIAIIEDFINSNKTVGIS